MATLQKIRTRAGLLVAIVIGISLAAFILGDMLRSGSSLFQRDRLEVGEVDGESIQYPEFQQEVEELGEIYRMNNEQSQLDEDTWVQIREQTWQNAIRQIIMTDVYDDLGITVSSEELFDMLQGQNLHPIVQQLFRNPNTGQVDRSAIVSFLKNLETGVAPEQRDYWLYLEDQIVEERIQTKYNNLVGKGLFVTSNEAQKSLEQKNKQVSFEYIQLPLTSVTDSQVVFTDKELRDYYKENKENYEQQKSRKIEYITFHVSPSDADYEDAEQWMNDAISDFADAEDNVAFVNSNSDEAFDPTWYKEGELPQDINAWVFETGAEEGDIFGPYFENEAYKLAKLHAREMMPDSVEARHILLQVNTQQEMAAKQALADSLKTAIENGSDFGELAREFSTDQGSAVQGGELGWFGRGMMVQPFEQAAFNNDINEVTIANSQFGIHIIQTTDKGELTQQVQIATLVRNVVPSTQTYQNVYAEASEFAGNNTNKEEFDAAVAEQQLNKRVATVSENQRRITGLDNARPLVRAAYETEVGDLLEDPQGSTIFDLGDDFVIATLSAATDEGVAAFEDVQDRVELAVIREKKAELLKEKAGSAMEGKTDLDAIAAELDAEVRSASNINFNAVQIPGAGMQPAVIGTAWTLETDQISEPVKGTNGVFIVKVTSSTQGTDQDVEAEQMRLAQDLTFRANSQAYNAHREVVEVKDKRAKFY